MSVLAQNRTLDNTRVAIATSHGRYYYRFARSLRALGVGFASILPSGISADSHDIVLCTRRESCNVSGVPVIHEDASDKHPVILYGMILQKLGMRFYNDELVLGVDPGYRTGLSVFYCGREIGASFYTSIATLISDIVKIIGELEANQKIIRIGGGNMDITRRIRGELAMSKCPPHDLEIIDEHGTTPRTHNLNRRGTRDMMSAKRIAQRNSVRLL